VKDYYPSFQGIARFIPTVSVLVVALVFLVLLVFVVVPPVSGLVPVHLGSAAGFAVLGGGGIVNTGSTVVTGDIGAYPVTTETGIGTVSLSGTDHGSDMVTRTAEADLETGYADAAGRTPADAGYELKGTILQPGVYSNMSTGSFSLSGPVILDGMGDTGAVFIFQIPDSLVTTAGSNVDLTNGTEAGNVFWQIGGSAVLGENSGFNGTLIATGPVTMKNGARIQGSVLSRSGIVTLDTAVVSTPVYISVSPETVQVSNWVLTPGKSSSATRAVVKVRTNSQVGWNVRVSDNDREKSPSYSGRMAEWDSTTGRYAENPRVLKQNLTVLAYGGMPGYTNGSTVQLGPVPLTIATGSPSSGSEFTSEIPVMFGQSVSYRDGALMSPHVYNIMVTFSGGIL
jgi:hypothetical protein